MTDVVHKISKINFEGNVVPMSWFDHIRTEADKPDAIGVVLLSDIVYWYRPTIVRDENTGQIKEHKKKFHADKLQRSYDQLAQLFGFSKTQVRNAIKRLEQAGLITVEFRTVTTKAGIKLSNVMYIEPVPERIEEITFRKKVKDNVEKTDSSLSTPMDKFIDTLPINLSTPMAKFIDTNTETTTEITNTERGASPNSMPKPESSTESVSKTGEKNLLRGGKSERVAEVLVAPSKYANKFSEGKNKSLEEIIHQAEDRVTSSVEQRRKAERKPIRNVNSIIALWQDNVKHCFGSAMPVNSGKDKKLLKTMIEELEYDTVLDMMNWMMNNWAKFSRECKIKTKIPTVGMFYGFREYLYGALLEKGQVDSERARNEF